MNIVCLDFESYYDTDYTLSKLTTDGYILDPRFKAHGVGVRYSDGRYHYEHEDVMGFLTSFDWANTAALCHNTAFDGFILVHRYGVRPAMWLDTLSMARSIFGVEVGGSLKAVAGYYGLPPKGTELVQTKGKRGLTADEQAMLGTYCLRDVEITWAAFTRMLKGYPRKELKLIDLTLRMFIEPHLSLNLLKLQQYKQALIEDKTSLLARVGLTDPASLNSAEQFAETLRILGVEPPTKISLRTGKEAYAFAKTDEGLKQLLEHESDDVRWLVEARLGAKSNIDQNRADRFIAVAEQHRAWPVLLNFSGASTTHRWSGGNKQNPQNLPSRGKTRVLREAVEAPAGYKIVVADSSQIEARVLAACAGQEDLMQGFADGDDVYSTLASDIYGFVVNKNDHPTERYVGKTCILGLGYGMGDEKFALQLKTQGIQTTTPEFTKQVVQLYRRKYRQIPLFWRFCERVLTDIACNVAGSHKYFSWDGAGVLLPSGLRIRYPDLRQEAGEWVYQQKGKRTKIYGAKLAENLCQALARCIIAEQMLRIDTPRLRQKLGHSIVLMAHDEIVCVAPEANAQTLLGVMLHVMKTPPQWGEDIPISAEGDIGNNYGDAK